MNNPLDDVLEITGLNANIFENSGPTLHATTNPQVIREHLSRPNTVYAQVEEMSDITAHIEEENAEEDSSSVESHIEDAIVIDEDGSSDDSTINDAFQSECNDLLEDFGFSNDTETIEIHQEEHSHSPEALNTEREFLNNAYVDTNNSTDTSNEVSSISSESNESSENTESSEEVGVNNNDENKIPLNSPSLLIAESTSRFSGASWYKAIQESSIIIAGQGGIGSNLTYQIGRMKPKALLLYDDDTVELSNMSGQLFCHSDIGSKKVDAMVHMLSSYTDMANAYAIAEKYYNSCAASDIMMCGFDNMAARREFYFSWKNHVINLPQERRAKCLYLDGRLSIDTLQVFAIRGDDSFNMRRYEKEFLFSDSEADATVCSLKQTTYMACMIASIMTNLFVNFTANTLNPDIPYDFPFFTEYDSTNMIFKTEV